MCRVSGELGKLAPQPATRATAPGWRDVRLWVGLLIVAASVLVGARVLASADDTVAVWAAREDLVAGSTVAAEDVVAVRVRFRDAAQLEGYLPADAAWEDGRVLLRDVGAGELVPLAATGEEPDDTVRLLPIAVDPAQVPPGVVAGSVVDVWAAGSEVAAADAPSATSPGTSQGIDPGTGAGTAPGTDRDTGDTGAGGALLVLEAVRVVEAPTSSAQVGGVAERQLVLEVPEEQHDAIPTALAALATGAVTVAQRG